MDLRVIGCHGGETPKHRTSAFILDERLAIDAGSLTSGLEVEGQLKLEGCLVSHAHLDHIRDLATLADNRCQMGAPPLIVAGTRETIRILRQHFFNNELWPDFATIPTPDHPTIRYLELSPETPVPLAGCNVRAVMVSHTIESAAFVIETPGGSIAYSGDTGPTDRLWQVLDEQPNLRALLMEVSFPNREQRLATVSGHHTPQTLRADLKKLRRPQDLPTLLYHIKPVFQAEVERECAALEGVSLEVMKIGDQFLL
ncbi:MAG TPA: 3',5'-cyclic-nucleotide phosphodiesterase [Polyangium sp.]|nr:3',5'-cyclic-nucleotide phosphodiesterase [Polyangium sp.]